MGLVSTAMSESILDFVLARLDERDETLAEIAEGAGLYYSAVQRIASRETPNPTYDKVQRLYDYFHRKAAA